MQWKWWFAKFMAEGRKTGCSVRTQRDLQSRFIASRASHRTDDSTCRKYAGVPVTTCLHQVLKTHQPVCPSPSPLSACLTLSASFLRLSQRGLLAALKRGIDDVVGNRENNLARTSRPGSFSTIAVLALVLLGLVIFTVIPLGGVCVVFGLLLVVWCHSRATDETDTTGDAIARSCRLLVAKEEEDNEQSRGNRQRGGDEEQGRAGGHQTGGGGRISGGDSNEAGGDGVGGSSAVIIALREEEDADFDFFLNGWGFCCPRLQRCCCCCCGGASRTRAPSAASSPTPRWGDSRRPALLSIKLSKELRAVRLIQLLKFADPRANAYLSEPFGQELLSGLQLHPSLPPGHDSHRGLDGPLPQRHPPAVVAVPIAFVA